MDEKEIVFVSEVDCGKGEDETLDEFWAGLGSIIVDWAGLALLYWVEATTLMGSQMSVGPFRHWHVYGNGFFFLWHCYFYPI